MTTACVLIIGNEILSGRTQDVNLAHIATTLNEYGVQVREARVVPDDESVIVATLHEVCSAFDYVLTTGGIGPTHDDITAECVAKAFGVPVVMHPDIEARIRAWPAGNDVMASRLRMARVPEGAELIENPTGGPQGFRIGNVFVMAGIPRVMQGMLSTLGETVHGRTVVRSRTVTVHVGESAIAAELGELHDAHPRVDIGSYPFFREGVYGTSLVLRGAEPDALREAFDALVTLLRNLGHEPAELA